MKKLSKQIVGQVISNSFIFAIMVLLFTPRFQNDIDIVMQAILYGVQGESMSRLVFSNIFLGVVLELAVSIMPAVPWYLVFHYLVTYIALVVIGYITVMRNDSIAGKTCAFVISVFAGYECYVTPSYMKTAALLCVAGVYLLFYTISIKEKKVFMQALGVMLLVTSSMICFSVFCIVGLISGVGIIAVILVDREQKVYVKENIILLVVLVLVIFGFKLVDTALYATGDEWNRTVEYSDVIEKVYGYGYPAYEERTSTDYEVNKEQYDAIVKGFFVTEDNYQFDVLKSIAAEKKAISVDVIDEYFKSVPIGMFKVGMFYLYIILIVIYMLSEGEKNYVILGIVTALMLITYFFWYINYANTTLWVHFMTFMPICILLLIGMKDLQIAEKEYIWSYIAILLVVMYVFLGEDTAYRARNSDFEVLAGVEEERAYVIDLTGYLKHSTVWETYETDLLKTGNIYVGNGIYGLWPSYMRYTSMPYPEQGYGLPWIYNSSNIAVLDMYRPR